MDINTELTERFSDTSRSPVKATLRHYICRPLRPIGTGAPTGPELILMGVQDVIVDDRPSSPVYGVALCLMRHASVLSLISIPLMWAGGEHSSSDPSLRGF